MSDSFQLKAIITGVDKLSPVLDGISKNIKKSGKGFKQTALVASAMGVGVATAFVKPIQDAMEFESSMADVRKVVNFDTPDQFKQMSQDILDMSTQLPMAATDIAKIVAAGGQAGIAADGLKEFATDAVKMGIAFDETADVAGLQMARWRTAFKMTQKEVDTLSDKINYLGNTGPATSGEIADIVTNVGTLATTAHVSEGNLAALGSTMAGVGVQVDVASTGIQNFILGLTNVSTKRAKSVLKSIHMTAKQVSKGMIEDSRGTMLKVLQGIKNLPADKQTKALEWLFGRESIKAIAPLLNNLDLLIDNFDKVADSTKYAGSMQKEYASRADTTANKLELVHNNLTKISTEMGDALLPTVNDSLQQAMPILDGVSKFIKDNPEIVKLAAGVAGAAITMGGMAAVIAAAAVAGLPGVIAGVATLIAIEIAAHWGDITTTIPQKMGGQTEGDFIWSQSGGGDTGSMFTDQLPDAFTNQPHDYLLKPVLDMANDLSNQLQLITGQGPALLTNYKNAPGYNYSAPTGQQILAGGRSLIQGEMVVRFENTPPGTRVSEGQTNAPNVKLTPDVGYSPYSMMRGNY